MPPYTLTQIDQHHFSSPEEEIYVLDAHRTASGLVVLSSDQYISLLDPSRISAGPIARFRTGGGGGGGGGGNVTALQVFDDKASVVCTAGGDGVVGVWDLRAGGNVARFNVSQAAILSMACSPETHIIATGTELENHTASVHLWDVRSTPAPKAQYDDLHSDDITSLSFHSYTPSYLVSGSTDGLASVHDTSIPDEDEVTIQTLNHGASIHEAAFLTPLGTEVFALSHDERFALYDVAEERANGDATQDFGDLRGLVACQYVAGVMTKNDGSGAVIGAGAQDRQSFEFIHLAKPPQHSSWTLDLGGRVVLPGAHGGEIVRSFCFYDDEQVVFTTGEDGNVKAWRPSG